MSIDAAQSRKRLLTAQIFLTVKFVEWFQLVDQRSVLILEDSGLMRFSILRSSNASYDDMSSHNQRKCIHTR